MVLYCADMVYLRYIFLSPLPHVPLLGSSNSAENKDMISKNIEIQLSYKVKNIVRKEEIAHYEQFILFPQCFQKLSVVDASK